MSDDRLIRWRLILGSLSNDNFKNLSLSQEQQAQDEALEFLYGKEYGQERNIRIGKQGGLGTSQLSVPQWINRIHELFPKKVIDRLEKDALERYRLDEIVTNPNILKRAEPSMTLLKAILQTKHLMNHEVLNMARDIARKVIQELMEQFKTEIESSFWGTLNKRRRSLKRNAANFDPHSTIMNNLKNYNNDLKKLIIKQPYFYSRKRNYAQKWQMIILVDQSGSMTDSIIYSAVCASIFYKLPLLKTHLVLFDTNIVDLTEYCEDPMETLMKVQLGGGTDIALAVQYGMELIENPRRCIFMIISDFYEGPNEYRLLQLAYQLIDSQVSLLGLAALNNHSEPVYNHQLTQQLVNIGAHIGAMTPGELAHWVSEKMGLS
ncbi:VWA domain-containing protein [Spirochaeta cellobiosiphila]|uniref:VWA domain-containing protein n=1 Tax=Spirochaeta cellobiosiphila TaxID=504483 RepID=UPI0004191629|nr:VWA domain-containing protein [Spirochaeta cellobiosiphila]